MADHPLPMACCPVDDDVLVMTFERPYKEFHCLTCGAWYEFFEPRGRPNTPERAARDAEARTLFDNGTRGPTPVHPEG